jgi:hypothetical protein
MAYLILSLPVFTYLQAFHPVGRAGPVTPLDRLLYNGEKIFSS